MYDFITDLFNIDKNLIQFSDIKSSPDLTQLFIALKPSNPPCPYCSGISSP